MPAVIAVSLCAEHGFSKYPRPSARLVTGIGVDGDTHAGRLTQHLVRIRRDPTMPNYRQVHLLEGELLDDMAGQGFAVKPGQLGENITTRGIALEQLPTGARLRLGADALIEITGLRSPCAGIDGIAVGLLAASMGKDADGRPILRQAVMAVVLEDGEVAAGDEITVETADPDGRPLRCI